MQSPVQPVSRTLITHWVVEKEKLMVVLRIEPLPRLGNLGGDLRAFGVEVFLLHLLSHVLGNVFLSGRVVENC